MVRSNAVVVELMLLMIILGLLSPSIGQAEVNLGLGIRGGLVLLGDPMGARPSFGAPLSYGR